jgi:hypothetical protein
MPAGILQLLVSGAQDKILVSNPQFNYFKQVHMKHSNFSIFNYEIPVVSKFDFDSTIQLEIPKNGDLLKGIQIKVELPALAISYNNPLDVEIENIKNKNSYIPINLELYDYNLYNLNTLKNILEYQQEFTTIIPNYQVYLYNFNTDTEKYKVVIPKIDLNQYINPSNKEYYFEINPDSFLFSNSNIAFGYPLITTPNVITNFDDFNNKLILYANRNNKLTPTINIITNLFKKNDSTVLLTSNNIKNMLLKKIKENMFQYEEILAVYYITQYINSIRFIRPITLYDDIQVKNLIHGADNNLIRFPEYNDTYYETIDLTQVILICTVDNSILNILNSRLLYVLSPNKSTYNINYNGIMYGLLNILKIDYITNTIFSSALNLKNISALPYANNIDLLSNINYITIKITPITSPSFFDLFNFSQPITMNSLELKENGDYMIILDVFEIKESLINKFIYFYYNYDETIPIVSPICIFNISNFYFNNNKLTIICGPLNFTIKNFTNDFLYLVDNNYLFQTNINNDLFDIKKITTNSIDIDTINLYKYYITIPANVNFYLDNTLETELNQKNTFINNFTTYLINNVYDNYSILYNIFVNNFKQPYTYRSTIPYATNLFFFNTFTNDGTGILSLSTLGSSTFAIQDSTGVSIMYKFFNAIYQKSLKNLQIINNYYLQYINATVINYGGNYINNWNSINNTIQKSGYQSNFLKTMNFLHNTKLYIFANLDNYINLTNAYVNIDVYNSDSYITSLSLSNVNIKKVNNSGDLYLYLNDFSSNISNIFLIKENYTLHYNNIKSNISNISYADSLYFNNLNVFLSNTTILNPKGSMSGNYILDDYILNTFDSIKFSSEIYLINKYPTNSTVNLNAIFDNNILYKTINNNYHDLLNNVDKRIKEVFKQNTFLSGVNISFDTDFENLTNGVKLTNYFYKSIINNYFGKTVPSSYYFINNYSNIYNVLPDFINNVSTNYTSFSTFINYIIDNDTFSSTIYGKLLKTYIYYVYGNQLLYQKNKYSLNISALIDTNFSYSNIVKLNIDLSNISSVYDVANIKSYLNTVTSDNFNIKNYKYNVNPHLYYSYLNLGYIENIISIYTNQKTDLVISNFTKFTYLDIDTLITSTLNHFEGTASITNNDIGNVILKKGNEYYSNIIGYSTIRNNFLTYENNKTNILLNDLITYSNYRIFDNTPYNNKLENICNLLTPDVKNLLLYLNDTIDSIQTLRFIINNNASITQLQLITNLSINNFNDLTIQNVNDYQLEFFYDVQTYNSLKSQRNLYNYNNVLVAIDNDTDNYYNLLLSINDTIQIGSSLKNQYNYLTNYNPGADIYNIVNQKDIYNKIIIPDLTNLKILISSRQDTYLEEYNTFLKNTDLLKISDDLELNTINNTIKSININSYKYVESLSSMDQFDVYNRKLFGYNIDTSNDIIYDIPNSLSHSFFIANSLINVSNKDYYNRSVLDLNTYETNTKTYQYQIKRIQSYFFSKVEDSNDSDLNYLKSFYALENYDMFKVNPLFISQLNKFYNYELSNDIISNITNLTKIDNNLNMYDHNYQRIVNNSFYYTDTLTILDNLKINKSISNSDVLTMKSFLANSVIYTNYTINCDSNTLVLTDKSPYYLINRGSINYISNGSNNLYIPIINKIIQKNSTFDILNYNTSSYFDFFYLNFLYILFDLYLLDGNMRISWSSISDRNNIPFFQNDKNYSFETCYRSLLNEYFYLLLKGKLVYENTNMVSINYSSINNIITKRFNYNVLKDYILYTSFNDKSFDLFNVQSDYKIDNVIKNHYYSENFATIFSIKNSFNDKNFKHLIDLTNYNNKFLSYLINTPDISNIEKVQLSFLNAANIYNDFTFYQNLVVTNYDYNSISNSSLLNANIYNSTFDIQTNNGNLMINMNDIANIKKEIIKYCLNEIKASNIITSTTYFNGNVSIQELAINNLNYNGNLITQIDLHPNEKTFSILQYDSSNNSFDPSNINSLTLWLDGLDKSNIFVDAKGLKNVSNIGDKIGKWNNKANINDNIIQNLQVFKPTWANCISFSGKTYFKSNININSKSSIYIVSDIPTKGGFLFNFDNDSTGNNNVGPAIWTDGPFGDFAYNDYNYNVEETFDSKQNGKNIYNIDRIIGSNIFGYLNGYKVFSNYSTTNISPNIILSSFPGHLDSKNNLSESISGNIYEILIFNDILTYDDKYKVNKYLASKWGFIEKIKNTGMVKYYDFPFDYLPKLYNYNVSSGNILIYHNHYFDDNFSNIYDNVYLEYRNMYNDTSYKISNVIDISNIVNYMYFTDFISDINSIIINNDFVYDLDLNQNTFNIINGNININSSILQNYNEYINQIDKYKNNFNIKDSFDFITNPLKYDTNYIRYKLMNFGSIFNSDSNIFHKKVEKLIEKTNYIPFNTNDRFYYFNEIVGLFFNITNSGKFNYEGLNLANLYIGNTKISNELYPTDYSVASYNFADYQSGKDPNVLILNRVIDISNRKEDLYDEKTRVYDNVLAEIKQTNGAILNYNVTNKLVEIEKLRPKKPLVSWIEKLGFYFSDFFEFYIGNQVIERIEDDFMNIRNEIGGKSELRKALAKMIGQDKKLVIKKTQLGVYLLYIDIPFYFNRYRQNHANAIPLIALLYNKLYLKLKLKSLDKLLTATNNTTITRISKMKMNLMLDYILLDMNERLRFAESKHEYLIEQVQYLTFTSSAQNITNTIKLNFKNPTKVMIWYAQTLNNIINKQYYNYTLDKYYINIDKYRAGDEIENPYLIEAKSSLRFLIKSLLSRNTINNIVFKESDIIKMPFSNFAPNVKYNLTNAVLPKSKPLIAKSELKVNGHTRFAADSDESQLIRPYTFFNNSDTKGINVYNFGLYPLKTQPSGSINFSFLNDINLLLDFNPIPDQEIKVKIMTVSYNLLRIMSGYGGLGFDTI